MSNSVPSYSVPSYLVSSKSARSINSPLPDFKTVPPTASPGTKEDLFVQNIERLYECSLAGKKPLSSAKLRIVLTILHQQTLAEDSKSNRSPSPCLDIADKAVFRPIESTDEIETVSDGAKISYCRSPNLEIVSSKLKIEPEDRSLLNKAFVSIFSLLGISSNKL